MAKKVPIVYNRAPEVEEMGRDLVDLYHPHLEGVPIRYLFKNQASKRGNWMVQGTCQLVQGAMAFLSTPEEEVRSMRMVQGDEAMPWYFLIVIAEDLWEEMSPAEKRALVDHELCHAAIHSETGLPMMREHDLEEFSEIVERHGGWKPNLVHFAGAVLARAKTKPASLQGVLSMGE